MKQQIYFEENISCITDEVARLQPGKILVVSGSSSYETCGAKTLIDRLFGQYSLVFYHDFSINPKVAELQKGLNLCRDAEIGLIIAIGGGSVIDMAKLIRCYTNLDMSLSEAIKSNKIYPRQNIQLIAIPTTAGSGSEATHFAVVYIDGCKYSVSHESICPNYVLLIPSLTYGSPRYLTACSGADALCQAIESYWSVQSTEESRNYAKEALLLLWRYLPLAVEDNLEARNKVMLAANLAGRAINISFTTAAHAYSYGLTSLLGVPHGHAVSLVLPYFFSLNLNVSSGTCNDPREVTFVRDRISELLAFLDCKPGDVGDKLSSFFQELFGEKNDEVKAKITDDIRKRLALSVNWQRLQNNPVKILEDDIDNIMFN